MGSSGEVVNKYCYVGVKICQLKLESNTHYAGFVSFDLTCVKIIFDGA